MSYTILNLTEPSRTTPIEGDYVQYNYSNGGISKQVYHEPEVVDNEAIAIEEARNWRNTELIKTDYIIPLTDHPDHTATLAYRIALRDWPSTSDFPDTKPTI